MLKKEIVLKWKTITLSPTSTPDEYRMNQAETVEIDS